MSIVPNPNADFSPTGGVYTELKPFRFWCQKVLPLVYDDSLSYYELLCKVVDYLNKTMEDVDNAVTEVQALHAAYDLLEAYVNNYFSTLDVQQEINNKLDAMVQSGALSALISPFVTSELPGVVEEQIPGVVGEQIGGTVAQQIGNTVAQQIGGTVAGQISPIVADWLGDNITPTTPAVDASLSIAGAAADAKATGDAVVNLKTAFNYFLDTIVTRGEKVDTGMKFKANGTVGPDAEFDIYAVELGRGGGEIYAQVSFATNALSYAQFQSTKYTSASDTTRIIGSPFNNPVNGPLEVPTVSTGSVYFLFNIKNTDTESGIITSDIVETATKTAEKTVTFEDKINRIICYPVLRNGSAGNPGNVNAVCPTQIIPTQIHKKIRTTLYQLK